MFSLSLWHLCYGVWVTENRCGSWVVIKSRSAAVKHGVSRGDNAYWQNLHKMSTAPFCSNFMLCTIVVKVNCSFVGGGGYKVKGEKKGIQWEAFWQKDYKRVNTLVLFSDVSPFFPSPSQWQSLFLAFSLFFFFLFFLAPVCSVQLVRLLSSGYSQLREGKRSSHRRLTMPWDRQGIKNVWRILSLFDCRCTGPKLRRRVWVCACVCGD